MRRERSTRRFLLLLLAVIVLGIYVLPSAVAKFAGSHTWELNETAGVMGLKCGRCHAYIAGEIGPYDGATKNVFRAHANALNNSNYVNTSGAPINMSSFSGNVDNTTVCLMCHIVEGGFTASTHTKVTIRVCTDVDCHGNSAGVGDTPGNTNCDIWTNGVCNVTGRINNSMDGHKNFYYPLTAYTSPYVSENGTAYDYGFVACLACHTHVGLSLNFTRPNELEAEFNLTSMTGSSTSAPWNITNLYVNLSSTNYSYGGKDPGSVWY